MTDSNDLDTNAFLEKELDRLLAWNRAAESRLTLLLPLTTAMLGALAVLATRAPIDTFLWGYIFLLVASAFLLLCLGMCWMAMFPRTVGPKGSLIYFGTIVHKSSAQYYTAVSGLSAADYAQDLANQCHRNAEVVNRKYQWISRAMKVLLIGTIPWLLAIILLLEIGSKANPSL